MHILASLTFKVSITFFLLVTPTLGLQCPSFCRYRLCSSSLYGGNMLEKENQGFILGVPESPMGTIVCLQRREDGFVQELRNITGGEARVSKLFKDDFVPISKFMKDEVSPRFEKDYLKFLPNLEGGSSIARGRPQRNQDRIVDQTCVQLPIVSYTLTSGQFRRTRVKSACVGFKATVPALLVDFEWDSPDDFDVTMIEPNGDVINRFGPNLSSTNGGRLAIDNNSGNCESLTGRERIFYRMDATVEEGTYVIRVDHHRACSRETRYSLRVLHEGRVIVNDRGSIMASEMGYDVVVARFTV